MLNDVIIWIHYRSSSYVSWNASFEIKALMAASVRTDLFLGEPIPVLFYVATVRAILAPNDQTIEWFLT